MADRVIVVGATRAKQRVPASEMKQMVGRAGRRHDGNACRATIIVDSDNAEDVEREMKSSESFTVRSTFGDSQSLAFHILPEIVAGKVTSVGSAEKWYSRSLGASQNIVPGFSEAFGFLAEVEAIEWNGSIAAAKPVGLIASRLYLHPEDLWAWKNNFSTLFEMELEDDDHAVAWALGTVPFTRFSGDFGSHWNAVGECKSGIPMGLSVAEGTIVTVTLWKYILGGMSVGKMRNHAMSLKRDAGRVFSALRMLDQETSLWNMSDFFDELESRCAKRIPVELAELCRIPGITKGMANYLSGIGVSNAEDIAEVVDNLEGEISDGFMQVLRVIADGVRGKSC